MISPTTGTTAGVRAPSGRAYSGAAAPVPPSDPAPAPPPEPDRTDRPAVDAADADTGGTLDERIERLENDVARLVRSQDGERTQDGFTANLARRAGAFDAALASQAEDDRERNALIALWTEQRKRDDAITDAVIKMI